MTQDAQSDETLVVIFGAGASYDSNPDIPVSGFDEDRPPLANNLFDMDRPANRAAAAAFPRAAPALMAARAAVKAGETIETTLARLQSEAEDDPRARSQLMALRFYLQRVLTQIPEAWDVKADRQTSYVSMLDQLARWQRATGHRLCLITFNYDLLLERACTIVYGHAFSALDSYLWGPGFRLYKPHGSVDWAQPAAWAGPAYGDQDAARRAVCDRPDLTLYDEIDKRNPSQEVVGVDDHRRLVAWIPALAIPVERKPAVVLPPAHLTALREDLGRARAVLCAGWRAREDHFLQILQASLPGRHLPLLAVAESRESARETVDNVWRTGRFDRFAVAADGFATFAKPEVPRRPSSRKGDEVVLSDVLRGPVPVTRMAPGYGLAAEAAAPTFAEQPASYAPLG